jgi:hypothetical protein
MGKEGGENREVTVMRDKGIQTRRIATEYTLKVHLRADVDRCAPGRLEEHIRDALLLDVVQLWLKCAH